MPKDDDARRERSLDRLEALAQDPEAQCTARVAADKAILEELRSVREAAASTRAWVPPGPAPGATMDWKQFEEPEATGWDAPNDDDRH